MIALQGKVWAVDLLLEAGASPDVALGTANWPPLVAAHCGDLDSLNRFLLHPEFSFQVCSLFPFLPAC